MSRGIAGRSTRPSDDHLWLIARHDFLQAAQSLRGLAPLVASTSKSADSQKLADLVAGLSNAMTGMVDIMTVLSEMEVNGHRSVPTSVLLAPLVARVAASYAPVAADRRARIVLGQCNETALAEPRSIEMALAGLMLTSLKLSSGGDIDVSSRAGPATATVELRIAFSGIDPAPSILRTAFAHLPALNAAPDQPFLAAGPALVAALARLIDGELTSVPAGAGRHALRLTLPAGGLAKAASSP